VRTTLLLTVSNIFIPIAFMAPEVQGQTALKTIHEVITLA